ncbi:MAG: hypothetical protein M1816_008156 [Peltula sp. TS41687]|nr:MAG: hypothetical protein M1816_008156 [Peltula sp. TS41687]
MGLGGGLSQRASWDTHAIMELSSSLPAPWVSRILQVVQFAYPITLLLVYLATLMVHSIRAGSKSTESSTEDEEADGHPVPGTPTSIPVSKRETELTRAQKALFVWLSAVVTATFVGNAVNIIVHALVQRPWWCGEAPVIYIVSCFFFYTFILISIIDAKSGPTKVHFVTWFVGFLLETIILVASVVLYSTNTPGQLYSRKTSGRRHGKLNKWELTEVLLDALRLVLVTSLIGSYGALKWMESRKERGRKLAGIEDPSEATGLLQADPLLSGAANGDGANGHGISTYGSTTQPPKPSEPETPPAWTRPSKTPSKNWWEYLRGYSLFFPYLWPSNSPKLQMTVVVCVVLVLFRRVINALIPYLIGVVTDTLAGENGGPPRAPWGPICLFLFLRASDNILSAIRSIIWIPVEQYSYRSLATSSFEHVHKLSLDFHLGKKTGEVISAMNKAYSINTFLELMTFQVVPIVIDLCVAVAYFLIAFDVYYALVVAIVTFCYIYITIRVAQWRAEIRREMVDASREEDAVKNDSLVSYETVKYFNAEEYEFNRYRNAVKAVQKAEYKVSLSLNILSVSQYLVFTLGLMVTCFMAAYQITTGQQKVGRFVTLLTYMSQLQGPLNYLGSFYRSTQTAMINAERMLELFKERPTVVDDSDVGQLQSCQGDIRFEDVYFSYNGRKPALSGLAFHARPGTKTALVGESGGGKSTIFRLLFRFYDVTAGRILVDGHDVRDISIDSLRRHIGVVPQDTVLFNETLMYNLKYANPEATDEMVYEACRAASIHDRILSFPDGYETKVGDRGLRLSGGEKQRVAIARTILKDPKVILLDEATAALDSETEQNIQGALEKLSQGRTMLVIAHRLSTITNADQILCLHAGQVVEAGTHQQLLKLKGRYANMWKKQIRAERAAEEARALTDEAEKLQQESGNEGDISGDTSENDSGGVGVGQTGQTQPTN